MFPKDFYQYLADHTLIEIKGGEHRHSFLKIWMVVVDQRVFARSWNKSEKSWFTEFDNSGKGQIKYGDTVIEVTGTRLQAEDPINERVSSAYIEKYKQPENLQYSEGISKPEYYHYTMEFKPEPAR